jgi:hypothetical protein
MISRDKAVKRQFVVESRSKLVLSHHRLLPACGADGQPTQIISRVSRWVEFGNSPNGCRTVF